MGDGLHKFGMVSDNCCCFYGQVESLSHLFYDFVEMRKVWCSVLHWLQTKHQSKEWNEELKWIVQGNKGKGWRSSLLKLVATKVVYGLWKYKNDMVFGNTVDRENIGNKIIDNIVYLGWYSRKLQEHIGHLMLV